MAIHREHMSLISTLALRVLTRCIIAQIEEKRN